MPQALSINRRVTVSINLAPNAAQMQNISTLLIMGSSNVIDQTERFRSYSGTADVAADFGTTAPEYLAAVRWFSQAPQPLTLMIGRWVKTAVAAAMQCATLTTAQQAIATWTAITSGGFEVLIDGRPVSLVGLSFAGATNLNGVASTIMTALQAKMPGSSCVWDANYGRFEFDSGTTGPTSSFGFLNSPTSSGSLTFSAQPTAADTITLNGTTITFVSGAPSANQVQIGASLSATLAALQTTLNASLDAQLVKFKYFLVGSVLWVTAATAGASGDALTLAKTSSVVTLSGATLTGGTAVDISAMLAGTATSSGAYTAPGAAAETAVAAVTLFDDLYGQQWYGLSFVGAADSDHLAVAAYIESSTNKHVYGVTTQEAGTISSVDTSCMAYQLSQLGYNRTATQYSSTDPYAVCSLLGRILTTDYNANNTVITLMYKQEPGTAPEVLGTSQANALEAKNCNVFVEYNNNTAIIEKGVMASGIFIDIITGTDWLALDIQNQIFNALYTTSTKIPQTDAGNHILQTVIEGVCAQGTVNALLAPGTWQTGGFGALNEGDFLPKGYYIYAPPIATQDPVARSARQSVPFQVAAKLAGAIHDVDVIINVNR